MSNAPVQAAATGLPSAHQHPAPTTFDTISGMGVVGDCMAPSYPDGCIVKASPFEPYGQGDIVVIWHRPDHVKPGRAPAMIKRIVLMPPLWVKAYPYEDNPRSDVLAVIMLGRDDRPDEMFSVPCSEILAIHKCIGILEPENISHDFRTAAERDRAAHKAKCRAVPT